MQFFTTNKMHMHCRGRFYLNLLDSNHSKRNTALIDKLVRTVQS